MGSREILAPKKWGEDCSLTWEVEQCVQNVEAVSVSTLDKLVGVHLPDLRPKGTECLNEYDMTIWCVYVQYEGTWHEHMVNVWCEGDIITSSRTHPLMKLKPWAQTRMLPYASTLSRFPCIVSNNRPLEPESGRTTYQNRLYVCEMGAIISKKAY